MIPNELEISCLIIAVIFEPKFSVVYLVIIAACHVILRSVLFPLAMCYAMVLLKVNSQIRCLLLVMYMYSVMVSANLFLYRDVLQAFKALMKVGCSIPAWNITI